MRDQKDEEKGLMKVFHQKVDNDNTAKQKETDLRKSKQREFFEQITNQMKSQVSKFNLIV